jgi:hypothetical protein
VEGRTRIFQRFVDPIKHFVDGTIRFSSISSVVVNWERASED